MTAGVQAELEAARGLVADLLSDNDLRCDPHPDNPRCVCSTARAVRFVAGDPEWQVILPSAFAQHGFTYVADSGGAVHLADESPLGGFVSGCDLFDRVVVCDAVPDEQLCAECREDAVAVLR